MGKYYDAITKAVEDLRAQNADFLGEVFTGNLGAAQAKLIADRTAADVKKAGGSNFDAQAAYNEVLGFVGSTRSVVPAFLADTVATPNASLASGAVSVALAIGLIVFIVWSGMAVTKTVLHAR
jgi:hypothetical protein